MKKPALLLAALATAFAGAAAAQKACTKAEEANAQKAIDRITTWGTLNSTWKSFRHCDSGPIGEQFTDAILRLIIDWKNVSQLADAMKDNDYKNFILNHLRSPEAKSDAPDVYSRAKANCPGGLGDWCKEIAAAVHETPPPPAPTPVAMPPVTTPQPGVPPQTPPPKSDTKK